MKSLKLTFALLATATLAFFNSASAQVSVSGGADLVSSYVWRGAMAGGASIQPYAEIGVGNFAMGTWASTSIEESVGAAEYDFYLSYSTGNFSALVTDYWCGRANSPYKFDGATYELTLAYTISEKFPLSLSVSSYFAGADKDAVTGDQRYSTYIEASYPLAVDDIDISLAVGATPAAGAYADKAAICNLSASASKEIAISESFSLPLSITGIVNPSSKKLYVFCGTSLSF